MLLLLLEVLNTLVKEVSLRIVITVVRMDVVEEPDLLELLLLVLYRQRVAMISLELSSEL